MKRIQWFMRFPGCLVAAISLLALASCNKGSRGVVPADPILPYKVETASDAAIIAVMDRLNKKGVQVVTLGQDYLIRIPSAALFPERSPQLTWGSYQLLDEIACYLRQFRKIAVSVTAFSSNCFNVPRERALTLARAREVGNYLWSRGIDSRFIFTHGVGADKPIVGVSEYNDQSPNARIEITFRDAVA